MGVKADFNPETFYWYLYLFQWNILSADKNIFADRRISQTVVLSWAEFKTFATNYEAPRKQYCESDMPCAPEYRRNHR